MLLKVSSSNKSVIPMLLDVLMLFLQFTHDNIVAAENERMASIQLRTLIDNVIQDTSRDMVEQCDVVDTAFAKRVEELEDAKAKMEENLKKVKTKIFSEHHNATAAANNFKANINTLREQNLMKIQVFFKKYYI